MDGLHALLADLVDAPGAVGMVGDQACLLEHPQVLGDRGPADRELTGDLADGLGAPGEALEDGPPGRVPESRNRLRSVSLHEP